MRRGEVWLADLDPVVGSEIGKARPVIIVSSDAMNEVVAELRRGVVTVVPVTTTVKKVFPFQVFLPAGSAGLRHDSKALGEQVRSLAFQRAQHRIGRLEPAQVRRLEAALLVHLSLD